MGRHERNVAFVTGGARGIGRAVVERLLAEGARVGFCDIDEQLGKRTADEVGTGGMFAMADVTDEASVSSAASAVERELGPVTVLVNNAGVNAYFDPVDMTTAEWDAFMAVDLRAAWLCAKHVVPSMRAAGGGAVVNVASLHARLTTRGMFPYAAAKSGLVGLTRSMALEFGSDGIRVNAVCPGWTRTPLVEDALAATGDVERAEQDVYAACPLGRMAEPDEVATVVAFLASDEASFVTGVEMYVDGGLGVRYAT